MKKQYEQLIALSPEEWGQLLITLLLLPAVALMLWAVGFKRSKSFLGNFVSVESDYVTPSKSEKEKIHTIVRIVKIAARYGPYRDNCLKQSLVLWWILARYGFSTKIKFGIQKNSGDEFSAHAWIEYGGINLCDSDAVQQQITPFNMSELEQTWFHEKGSYHN